MVHSLTVAALTLHSLTVAALTLHSLTVAALTVHSLTVGALTLHSLTVAALRLQSLRGMALFGRGAGVDSVVGIVRDDCSDTHPARSAIWTSRRGQAASPAGWRHG